MARPEITGWKLTDDPEDQHFLPPPTGPPPLSRRSYSISEFCQTEGFSRGYYYGTLKKQGLNPDETRPGGNTVRITEEARARWHRRHTVKPTKLKTES